MSAGNTDTQCPREMHLRSNECGKSTLEQPRNRDFLWEFNFILKSHMKNLIVILNSRNTETLKIQDPGAMQSFLHWPEAVQFLWQTSRPTHRSCSHRCCTGAFDVVFFLSHLPPAVFGQKDDTWLHQVDKNVSKSSRTLGEWMRTWKPGSIDLWDMEHHRLSRKKNKCSRMSTTSAPTSQKKVP